MTYTVQETSLTGIADAIRTKTKREEKLTFPDGFVEAIGSIKAGGGTAVAEKDVNFYDYDGTLVASYTEDEAKVLKGLPTPPEHNGLTFQGWNYTLDEVHTYAEAADVGALYETTDGATRVKVTVTGSEAVLSSFKQSKESGVVVDWGDGNSERTTAKLAVDLLHKYEAPGDYTISVLPDEGCTLELGYSSDYRFISGKNAVVRQVYLGRGVTVIKAACFKGYAFLDTISMGPNAKIENAVFSDCSSLRCITVPRNATGLLSDVFSGCVGLEHVSCPPYITVIGANSFMDCRKLSRAILRGSYGVVTGENIFISGCSSLEKIELETTEKFLLPAYSFSGCVNLKTVICKCNISYIGNGAMLESTLLAMLDLTGCVSVPDLLKADSLPDNPVDLRILVPAALADEWKQATNWVKYADKIIGV